jgi:hypothetical protein
MERDKVKKKVRRDKLPVHKKAELLEKDCRCCGRLAWHRIVYNRHNRVMYENNMCACPDNVASRKQAKDTSKLLQNGLVSTYR